VDDQIGHCVAFPERFAIRVRYGIILYHNCMNKGRFLHFRHNPDVDAIDENRNAEGENAGIVI